MPKFNTMFDIAFEVEHDYDLPEEVHEELIILALEKRLMEIKQRVMDGDREGLVGEVFGICDTYEIPQ